MYGILIHIMTKIKVSLLIMALALFVGFSAACSGPRTVSELRDHWMRVYAARSPSEKAQRPGSAVGAAGEIDRVEYQVQVAYERQPPAEAFLNTNSVNNIYFTS